MMDNPNSPYPPRWCDPPKKKPTLSEPKRTPPPPQPTRKPRTPQARKARKEAELRRIRRRTLGFLYTILAIEAVAAVWTSPVFAVKQVHVSGTTEVAANERTQAEQLSQLPPQTHFLLMIPGGMQRKLSGLMWVKHAEISRRLPNIIEAHVTPRTPFALVTVAATAYEVDAQGFPIRTTSPENSRLPHLMLSRNVPIVAGKVIADVSLTQTLVALHGMESGLRERMAKILIDSQGNLCLNMRDGIEIQCGQAENLDSKFALVRRIYEREPTVSEHLVGINVSVPEKPACTLRNPVREQGTGNREQDTAPIPNFQFPTPNT